MHTIKLVVMQLRLTGNQKLEPLLFDIQRKLSTESSGVFSQAKKIFQAAPKKSFVDPKAKPRNPMIIVLLPRPLGQVTVDSANVRVSEPIIYLAPSKSITGRVVDADNAPISNAEVVWREEVEKAEFNFTGDDGSFELTAGSGNVVIKLTAHTTKVDWFYDSAPKT